MTYDRHVEFIEISPSLGFRLDDVDLLELEGSRIPNLRKNRFGASAEATMFASKQGNAAGLQKPTCEPHGWCCSQIFFIKELRSDCPGGEKGSRAHRKMRYIGLMGLKAAGEVIHAVKYDCNAIFGRKHYGTL